MSDMDCSPTHPKFCDRCEVSLDLHMDQDDPDPADCENAERKADLIGNFWRVP